MDDGYVADIKRGRVARNAKLASIPVGFAGRAALGFGKRLTGKSKDEVQAEMLEKAANQLFTVLGELKGGAMKVGQALSVMEAAIPEQFGEPYREALTKLQKDAPPLPAAKVHRVLDAQLGTKWRERFSSFDDTPVASASIGQVHKALWSDGREVAVKIQYPGADEALRADLKTMQRMVGMVKQLSPGADVQGVVDELIQRTEMELDYRLEADNQRAFAKAYHDHPHFAVPHIVASAPKVVIQEWIDGVHMAEIIRNGTPEQRDLIGTRLIELTFDAPRRLGMMHGDAHPGNFMLLPDGRMGVIDFGAVAPLPGGFPIELGMIMRLTKERNYDLLLADDGKGRLHSKGPAGVGARHRRNAAPVRRADRGGGLPLHPQVAAEDDRGSDRPVGVADQDGSADGPAGQAGHSDAGDLVGGRDPLPVGCARADQGALGRADPRFRRARHRGRLAGAQPRQLRRLTGFAWTSARAFATHDRPPLEDLAAPHTPGFGPFQRRRQALAADRAARAQRLGALQIGRGLGEPQVGIADMTRQLWRRLSGDCQCRHVLLTCFLVWWLSFVRRSGPGCGLSTRKLWPRILVTSGPWPSGEKWAGYGMAPIHGRVGRGGERGA